MLVKTKESYLPAIKEMIETIETNISKQLMIVSTGDFTNRGKIFEFYGSNFDTIWWNFLTAYHVNKLDQATYLRIDIVIEEEKNNYEQFIQHLKKSEEIITLISM